jgi:transposase
MGCSESWVRDLIKRRRETGSLDVLPSTRQYESKLDQGDLERLARLIDDKPDLTLGELAAALSNKASVPTVWRATRKLGYSLKKRPSTPPSRTART